ncbi:MAG: hypothetical protein ABR987_14535 [Terracidiphilus sp.]|jgi:hypothetical protein
MEELEEVQPKKRGIWPALGLFFLAPLVAEFLLGDLSIKLLPAMIVLAPAYGGGALLIREMVRRTGRGWPSIVLLGMAYAIFAEAFTTQSLFNPNYMELNLGLLTPAFIPWLGISAWWTLWMFMVHALWSISTPIALVEACVPDRARTPWLGRKGVVIVALLFLLGEVASTAIGYKQDHFMASIRQFVGAAVVVIALAALAFVIAPRRGYAAHGRAPSPWLVGSMALLFASVALLIPKNWGWGAVAALLGLDAAMLLLVVAWSSKGAWGLKHQLALGAGAAFAYGWHAFLQHPVVGKPDPTLRIGNAIFLTGAVALVCYAARRNAAKPESAL